MSNQWNWDHSHSGLAGNVHVACLSLGLTPCACLSFCLAVPCRSTPVLDTATMQLVSALLLFRCSIK